MARSLSFFLVLAAVQYVSAELTEIERLRQENEALKNALGQSGRQSRGKIDE